MNKINIAIAGSSLFTLENIKYIFNIKIYNILFIIIKKNIHSKEINLIKNFAKKNNIFIIETKSLKNDSVYIKKYL